MLKIVHAKKNVFFTKVNGVLLKDEISPYMTGLETSQYRKK